MNANLANHMSNELLALLPMWSKVEVEKAEDGDLTLVARIPVVGLDGDGDSLELVPAFRLVMESSSSAVYFVGGPWRSAMDERFKPQAVVMTALKARLEKFWFSASSLLFFFREG
jgi:hypothetical protein